MMRLRARPGAQNSEKARRRPLKLPPTVHADSAPRLPQHTIALPRQAAQTNARCHVALTREDEQYRFANFCHRRLPHQLPQAIQFLRVSCRASSRLMTRLSAEPPNSRSPCHSRHGVPPGSG